MQTWLAPVNGIEPETGLHIWWLGLWMERAEGISLNQLSYITRKTFVEDTIMDLLQTKLNTTRVIRSAMLDLLTSQCDRHGQNVFINEKGQLKLIDNLQVRTGGGRQGRGGGAGCKGRQGQGRQRLEEQGQG